MIEFLDWLARAGGATAAVLVVIGYVFREKWKQILAKSLAQDLERLKADLAKSHADYTAALAPQLEGIKHDFQQKLEAYKVSLIADAEAAKARSELKKSIAMRFAEIEFERLVSLEGDLGPIYPFLLSRAGLAPNDKTIEQTTEINEYLTRLGIACDKAEMFMSSEDRLELIAFRSELHALNFDFIGPGKPIFSLGCERAQRTMRTAASTHRKIKDRITSLGVVT